MNILVTGGTGFLGRHVVWRLAELGHQVTFTGRQHDKAQEVIEGSVSLVSFVEMEHGAVGSKHALTQLAQGMQAVVHCAALSSPWGAADDFYKANVKSAEEVITACEINAIKRLVHISTPSLYFDFSDRLNVREDDQLPKPVNEYARTKAQAELLLTQARIPEIVILRPRALFGPCDDTLMPRLLRVIENGAVPLMRGGQSLLDITYIDNAVEAIILSLFKPLPRKLSIYNVTNGEPYVLNDLLAMLAEKFELSFKSRRIPWPLVSGVARLLELWSRFSRGKEPAITRYSAGVLAFSQTLNIESISEELGYHPAVTIEEGLTRHAQWYFQEQKRARI